MAHTRIAKSPDGNSDGTNTCESEPHTETPTQSFSCSEKRIRVTEDWVSEKHPIDNSRIKPSMTPAYCDPGDELRVRTS